MAARRLAEAGIAVDDLSLRQPTLDEVFLTLTGSPPIDATTTERRQLEEADRMTAITDAVRRTARAGRSRTRPRGLLHDTWVIARRGLVHMKRQPEALSDATIQPIMFVLLFAYVFGGAIDVPGGGSYREFLMGGIFAQTIVFTAFGVAMSLANDRKNQAVDRFRALPIAKGAVLGGHAVANLLKSLLPIVAHVAVRAASSAGGSATACVDAVGRLPAAGRLRLRHDLGRRPARQRGGHARGRDRASPSPCCSRSRSWPARSCPPRRCPACCGRSPSGTR